jgi:hypothetical protein
MDFELGASPIDLNAYYRRMARGEDNQQPHGPNPLLEIIAREFR